MRTWVWKHRALFGYLFLLGVTLLALEWHHDVVTEDLNRRDAISCEQRQTLAANQRMVLATLVPLVHAELREHGVPEPERGQLLAGYEALRDALATAGPQPCE